MDRELTALPSNLPTPLNAKASFSRGFFLSGKLKQPFYFDPERRTNHGFFHRIFSNRSAAVRITIAVFPEVRFKFRFLDTVHGKQGTSNPEPGGRI
jgi:hypothetical protein